MVNIPLNPNDHGGIGEYRDAQTFLSPKKPLVGQFTRLRESAIHALYAR